MPAGPLGAAGGDRLVGRRACVDVALAEATVDAWRDRLPDALGRGVASG